MSSSVRTRSVWLWVAVGAFIAAAVVINPLRQMTLDDDWAYALTVKHLLETGRYQLHDWAAANMPFQAGLGALFSWVLGFSPAVLRLVTVVMGLFGLIAFYKLAREHDLDQRQAGLLALIWAACPLLLRMTNTFMTDVTFLTCMVTAIWLYARAIRGGKIGTMILASAAATAAILTRQFGLAIVVGLAVVWLTDRELRPRVGFFVAGLALPVAAAIWQLTAGLGAPTWAQGYAMLAQREYTGDVGGVLLNVLWRPAVLLAYMALFVLPLVVPLAAEAWHALRRRDGTASIANAGGPAGSPAAGRAMRVWIIAALIVVVGILVGRFFLGMSILMPYVKWNLDVLKIAGKPGQIALTAVLLCIAVLIARAWLLDRFARGSWHASLPAARLLMVTSLVMLVLHIGFFKYGDEYLLSFLPFGLIAAGHAVRSWLSRHQRAVAVAAFVTLAAATLWVRGMMEGDEAAWHAADTGLARAGGNVTAVFGRLNWDGYHGVFDDYLAATNRRPEATLDSFFVWYGTRRAACSWVVTTSPSTVKVGTWNVDTTFDYRGRSLGAEKVYLMRRTDPGR